MQSLDEGTRLEFLIVAQEQEPAQQLAEMLRGIPTEPSHSAVVSIALGASRVLTVGNADVVFVSADRPHTGWADVLRRLATDAPATPVVAVLQQHDDAMCAEAMAAGASACVTLDPADHEQMLAAVGCAVTLRRATAEHARVQASLQDEVDRLHAALAAAPLLLFTVDTSLRCTWMGRTRMRLDGDLVGKRPSDWRFATDVEALERQMRDVLTTGVDVQRDVHVVLNAVPRDLDAAVSVIRNAEGEIVGLGVAAFDETRARAEHESVDNALRASESMFRNAMSRAPIGMAIVSAEGRWLRVNQMLCEMLGYAELELLSQNMWDVTHPEDVAGDSTEFRRLFAGEIPFYELEKRFIHKSGRVVWAQSKCTVVYDDQRRPLYAVAHIQDITERHRSREASEFIAEAGHVLASSLDSAEIVRTIAHLAVPRLGDWCTIDLLSAAGTELVAAESVAVNPEKEETLRQIRARYPVAPFSFDHPVSRVIRTGQATLVSQVRPDSLNRIARDADHLQMLRHLAAVSWMIVPLAARGRIIGAITFAASESGRHYGLDDLRIAEELATSSALAIDNARLFDDARAAARLRDDVLGFVTHDLRNPLAAIVRWATRLDDDDTSPEVRRRATAGIRDAAEVMNSLITDLLDLTRLESGHLRVEPEPVRPDYLLTAVRDMFESAAQAKGVELRVELGELPRIHADPQRIHQVLSNLIGNALRFVPSGGQIVVRAQQHQDDVLFSVMDTGPGIAPEDVPRVFDRFWQAAHARKTGAGLGLTIARGIVEAHRGRIWIESQLRRGSTFYFTLPVWHGAIPEVAPVEPPAPVPAPVTAPVETLRVLVAEDHPLTRAGLVQLLNSQPGITVVGEAATGEQAVELVPKLDPDVVIMDLSMPGIGGVEATRRIVAQASDAVILVLTADEAPATLADALRAGARGYLRKTINERDLVTSLRVVARGEVLIDPALKDFLRAGMRAPVEEEAMAGLRELSERERKVLTLAAQGYTAAQAGERLFLSPKTVETYRSRAMRKLGLETRADLVAFALRIGLLSS